MIGGWYGFESHELEYREGFWVCAYTMKLSEQREGYKSQSIGNDTIGVNVLMK